jgi:predicted nucleic acid-binding protein
LASKSWPRGGGESSLRRIFVQTLAEDFDGGVLDLDQEAAERAATLCAERRQRGCTVEMRDTMIAGIALSRHAQLATRNLRHFNDLNVAVIDPWTA